MVVRFTNPAAWSTAVVCTVAISCCPRVLRTISSPLESGAYRKLRSPSPGRAALNGGGQRLFRVHKLGLSLGQGRGQRRDRVTGPVHGLASAARTSKLTAPDFERLAAHAMPDGLLGVLRHQGLELVFRPLVVEKGLPGVAEQRRELGPGVRRAHVDDADGLDARPRRLGIDQMGDFAGLHAAPEFLFGRNQDAQSRAGP